MYKASLKNIVQKEATISIQIQLLNRKSNGIIVFICTDAWAPICIFLYVSGQIKSVQWKPIGSL